MLPLLSLSSFCFSFPYLPKSFQQAWKLRQRIQTIFFFMLMLFEAVEAAHTDGWGLSGWEGVAADVGAVGAGQEDKVWRCGALR